MDVSNDEVMRALTKMVVEQFTASLATRAREFSKTLPKGTDGTMALEAFASAIESTNNKMYPLPPSMS